MFAGQSAQHQNISHGTIQNGSQGVYGSARDVYFGSCTNPQEIIEQRAKLCRDALFVSEPEVDRLELVTNKGTRVTGTCEWIKNNGGYRSWNQGETPLLWVTGGPGKGKTMLSIFLTEDLEQELSKYNAGQLVYYFCIHKKRDKGTDLLRSLLYQIIDKRPELAKHAFTYLEMPERRAHTLSSLPSLWIILQNIIADATLGDLFCIVDGLDECDEDTRRFLIPRFVDQLEPQSSPNQPESLFRIIIVSRDLEGLEGCEKIDLDEDHASNDGGDIELFVCEKVKELFQRKKLDVVFQPTVREALISGANGTFLWVGFVINELLKVRTWSQVCKQLKSLPGDLSNIYDRMLLGIPSENRETSSLILQWVCLAQRPLKVAELAQAVGLKPAPQIICSKGIEPLPRSVLLRQTTMDEISLCGQMLKVEHEEVTLVHQSARDYLLRCDTDSNDILEFFRVRQKETRRMIARICFDIIAQNADHRITMWELCLRESEDLPLLEYATSHWEKHIQHCPDVENKLFSDLDDFFQPDSTLRAKWWESYLLTQPIQWTHTPPLLHIVSFIGVPSWVEAIFQNNPELKSPYFLDQRDEREMTPLHWAVRGGSKEVVQLLLVHGVDVDVEDDLGFTPLQRSFENEDEVVAQQLLDQDASFTIHQFRPNPFYQAARWGNKRMLNMLLEGGPDINKFDLDGIAALHHAVLNGESASVQLLLELNANSNAMSDDLCNKIAPLHLVPETHGERIIKLLLDRGADLEARDYSGRTPLYVSCQSGLFKNVRLLIEMGANMWVKDDSGGTLLHAAVDSGSEAMVRLFLHKGLDFQAKNNARGTLLHQLAWRIAPENGIGIFRLLISLGVDINEKNHEGSTALHIGAKGNYPEIVQPLIENGANLEARNISGKTSLHFAVLARSQSLMIRDHTKTIGALIQGGADVSARDNQGYTPLDYADSLYREELETWIKDRVLN